MLSHTVTCGDKANKHQLCSSHQKKGSINQGCHKGFYRDMFFWIIISTYLNFRHRLVRYYCLFFAHQTCKPMVRKMLWSFPNVFRITIALGFQGSLHWWFELIQVGQVQILHHRHDSLALFATCLKGGWPRPVHIRSNIQHKACLSIAGKSYSVSFPRTRKVATNSSNRVKCK